MGNLEQGQLQSPPLVLLKVFLSNTRRQSLLWLLHWHSESAPCIELAFCCIISLRKHEQTSVYPDSSLVTDRQNVSTQIYLKISCRSMVTLKQLHLRRVLPAWVRTGSVHCWSSLASECHGVLSCPVPVESAINCITFEWAFPYICDLPGSYKSPSSIFSPGGEKKNNYLGLQNQPFKIWFYLSFVLGNFTSVQCILTTVASCLSPS